MTDVSAIYPGSRHPLFSVKGIFERTAYARRSARTLTADDLAKVKALLVDCDLPMSEIERVLSNLKTCKTTEKHLILGALYKTYCLDIMHLVYGLTEDQEILAVSYNDFLIDGGTYTPYGHVGEELRPATEEEVYRFLQEMPGMFVE